MYISEPFLNVKAVHFWGVLNFFFFFFFLWAFCSELLLYIANNLKENKKSEVHFKSTVYRWYNTLKKKTLIKRNNNNKDLHFKCHSYIPCGWELYTFTHFFRWINYWITETTGGVSFLCVFSVAPKFKHCWCRRIGITRYGFHVIQMELKCI